MGRTSQPKKAGPKPRTVKKAAPLPRCIRGHTQARGWAHPAPCYYCNRADEKALEGLSPAEYRERRRSDLGLGPVPDVMTMRTGDGQLISFDARPRRRRGR